MAEPTAPSARPHARPVPPEWRSAIAVSWINLGLAVLILPLIGLLTTLVGVGLYANNVRRTLAVFFIVAGIAAAIVFTITGPAIHAVYDDEAPEEVREFFPDGSDKIVIP